MKLSDYTNLKMNRPKMVLGGSRAKDNNYCFANFKYAEGYANISY
jgi:hypothetical protein